MLDDSAADDYDDFLSDMSQADVDSIATESADPRVVHLLRAGAKLEDGVPSEMERGNIEGVMDRIDSALAKYHGVLLLNPTSHVALRRSADALLRKAGYLSGSEADALYCKAIETYDLDILAHNKQESHRNKVVALVDRAKNKAEEEDVKGVFAQTRRLLSEAQKALLHVHARDDLAAMIAELESYCKEQSKAKKADVPVEQAAAAVMASKVSASKTVPKLSGSTSLGPTTGAKVSAKSSSTLGASSGAGVRKSVIKADNISERDRLQNALDAKPAMHRQGRLSKEGGGNSVFGRKTWKERMFELTDSALEWYANSSATEKPKGTISLFEVVTVRPVTVSGHQYTFELVSESRKLPIEAASLADRDAWVKALLHNIDRCRLLKRLHALDGGAK